MSDDEKLMDLLLWRHAEAEDGMPDAARQLTKRGHKQAEAVAKWLSKHLPEDARILSSPATRTRQTVDALGRHYETSQALAVDTSPKDVLKAAGWHEGRSGTVLIVGHQPTLGQVAATLMSGKGDYWSIKKGALWWFTARVRDGEAEVVLKTVISPEFL